MNDAAWGDGNLTRTTSEDYYQDAGPASAGEQYLQEQPHLQEQPYFWDSSQTQVGAVAVQHGGSSDNVTIQDQGNAQAVPSTYREYCFGMVSSPGYAIFRFYLIPWPGTALNNHQSIKRC